MTGIEVAIAFSVMSPFPGEAWAQEEAEVHNYFHYKSSSSEQNASNHKFKETTWALILTK